VGVLVGVAVTGEAPTWTKVRVCSLAVREPPTAWPESVQLRYGVVSANRPETEDRASDRLL